MIFLHFINEYLVHELDIQTQGLTYWASLDDSTTPCLGETQGLTY